jgi:NTE family protein
MMVPRRVEGEDKIALVMAGGGMTGAVYEIGALRAIDDLLVDRSVNDFDIYVGTSAGAIVASFLANGISPEEMYRAIAGEHPSAPPIKREDVFSFNYSELARRGLSLPLKLAEVGYQYLRDHRSSTLVDALWNLTDVLPSGLYDASSLERYMRRTLHACGTSNDFRALQRELYIVTTDLDTGDRVVFGSDVHSDVPISLTVSASCALPMVYRPVRIRDREFVDGGMRGTASLDIAIEHGATLVVCVNPMVPYDNSPDDLAMLRGYNDYFSSRGFSAIASQVSRISIHSGLRYQIKQLRRQHPEVDVILVEPRGNDQMLAFGNIMRYAERLQIAQHGFESVTLDLAEDYFAYKQILARHGVPLSRRLVMEELAEIRQSGDDPRVIERILEARKPACDESNRDSIACRLSQVLAELELELDNRLLAREQERELSGLNLKAA